MVEGSLRHRPILRDAAAELALTRQGYVVMPLLGAAAASRLLAQLGQEVPVFPEGFYASVHTPDARLRAKVNALLMSTFLPLIEKVCLDVKLLGGAFINKAPGPRGVLPPHQDWNIVDEARQRSFNVWLPLVDTDDVNGAIQVLPGSHLWLPTVRGPSLPCVYRQVHARLREAMKLLPIRAGEVLVYDHRLLHCSDENRSQHDRPGAVMGMVPSEAELKHFCPFEGAVGQFRSSVEHLIELQTRTSSSDLRPERVLADLPATVDEDMLTSLMSDLQPGLTASS